MHPIGPGLGKDVGEIKYFLMMNWLVGFTNIRLVYLSLTSAISERMIVNEFISLLYVLT